MLKCCRDYREPFSIELCANIMVRRIHSRHLEKWAAYDCKEKGDCGASSVSCVLSEPEISYVQDAGPRQVALKADGACLRRLSPYSFLNSRVLFRSLAWSRAAAAMT